MQVFGIGWHRTGTRSLATALSMLGIPCKHWPFELYKERHLPPRQYSYLKTYRALCDFPVPLLYKKLAEAFPDARFILTCRESYTWLQSAQNHFEHQSRPHPNFEGQSYLDVLSQTTHAHDIHTWAYGRTDFNKTVFKARFEQHNAEVIRFFEGRDNLLILPLEAPNKWEKLCAFLGKQVPPTPYPHLSGS